MAEISLGFVIGGPNERGRRSVREQGQGTARELH